MDSVASVGTDLTDAPSITLTAADLAAIEGLRQMHAARADAPAGASDTFVTETALTNTAVGEIAGTSADSSTGQSADAACPIPGFLRGGATSCPIGVGADPTVPVERSRADRFVRRLLRIPDRRVDLSDAGTYKAFQRSMAISAVRCTLTYVIFPFVLPGISFLKGVGPVVGVVIGTIALVCDVYTIRRFFAVDHKYRWHFSTIVFGIMCLLSVLLVQDISHLVGHLLDQR